MYIVRFLSLPPRERESEEERARKRKSVRKISILLLDTLSLSLLRPLRAFYLSVCAFVCGRLQQCDDGVTQHKHTLLTQCVLHLS